MDATTIGTVIAAALVAVAAAILKFKNNGSGNANGNAARAVVEARQVDLLQDIREELKSIREEFRGVRDLIVSLERDMKHHEEKSSRIDSSVSALHSRFDKIMSERV